MISLKISFSVTLVDKRNAVDYIPWHVGIHYFWIILIQNNWFDYNAWSWLTCFFVNLDSSCTGFILKNTLKNEIRWFEYIWNDSDILPHINRNGLLPVQSDIRLMCLFQLIPCVPIHVFVFRHPFLVVVGYHQCLFWNYCYFAI